MAKIPLDYQCLSINECIGEIQQSVYEHTIERVDLFQSRVNFIDSIYEEIRDVSKVSEEIRDVSKGSVFFNIVDQINSPI